MYQYSSSVLTSLLSIDNQFYQNIANMGKNLGLSGNFLDCDFNSEYFEQKDNQTVLPFSTVPPFYQIEGNKTIFDELAYMRWHLGFPMSDIATYEWSDEVKEAYAMDYFLVTSLCLVEIFDTSGQTAEKFLATRSPLIATFMNQDYEGTKMAKLESAIQMTPLNYKNYEFRLLKLSANQNNGFRIITPKKSYKLKGKVKLTPIAMCVGFLEGIQEFLQQNIVKFTYMKDNLTYRDLVSTLNVSLLHKYYDADYVHKALMNRKMNLARGYMPLPELGLSKTDDSGTRALNFTRIHKIEVLPSVPEDLERYMSVDFSRIVPALKAGIENIGNIDVLRMIYYEIKGEQPHPSMDFYTLKYTLLNYIDMANTTLSTTAQRQFHDYMLTRENYFPNYKAGAQTFQPQVAAFNMGFD